MMAGEGWRLGMALPFFYLYWVIFSLWASWHTSGSLDQIYGTANNNHWQATNGVHQYVAGTTGRHIKLNGSKTMQKALSDIIWKGNMMVAWREAALYIQLCCNHLQGTSAAHYYTS